MKFYVAFALLFIGAVMADDVLEDGRPDCHSKLQVTIENFRHKTDPTKFWVCKEVGKPAELASCQQGKVFVFGLQKCISPSIWEWDIFSSPTAKPKTVLEKLPWKEPVSA